MQKLNLTKVSYNKSQYEKVIDTKFSQLAVSPSPELETSVNPLDNTEMAISEFFQSYSQLFFQIPKFGDTNSHEFLIKQSTDYVGSSLVNDDIQALIDEINLLQQQNLELNQRLVETQISSSQQI